MTDTALARSEAKYRRLFEAAHDGILILDAETGEITAVNPFLCTLLGYAESEMLGKKLWEIGPFHDEAHSRIAFKELQANQYIRYEDLPLETRDGRAIAVEFVSNVYEVSGQQVIQCNIRDITERKHAEEAAFQSARVTSLRAAVGLALSESGSIADALQACAEAFVMHFSASLAQIWTCGESGGDLVLRANAGILAQPDPTKDGVPPGHSMIERIAASGAPIVTNTALDDPQVSDHAWAVRERIVAFAGYPLRVDGRVVGVLGLFAQQPLTEAVLATLNSLPNHLALSIDRRASARELVLVEERMRFAMQSANVGIWDLDYGTGALTWSDLMETQYGIAPGSFAGTQAAFLELIHPEDRAAVEATIDRAARAGTDFSVLHRVIRPDGALRWLRGDGRFRLDAQGRPARASGISRDVTELIATQTQDQQTQKMEAIGRLAGGVAHDFNNLLTVMLGFCELALGNLRPNDPVRDDVTEIQRAGLRAAALTRQLLTFSRRSITEPKPLDVDVVVHELDSMIGRLIGDDVKVVTRLRAGGSRVLADRGQIEQVIVNLAVNARDAMPKGGTITIETATVHLVEVRDATRVITPPGPFVLLAVADTGTGMTPDALAHIFEPFFTTKAIGEGTGLGLATVHGIVMQSGGRIEVHSELDKGTLVQVYLPITTASDAIVEAPSAPHLPAGTGETLLVVEDSDSLRSVTRRLLEQGGYRVVVAASAAEALRIVDLTPTIDLVLSDVVMPGGNGPELVARIVERRPGIPVVYMSGYSRDAISHHGVLDPGIAFLQKPFTALALLQKVREQLDT